MNSIKYLLTPIAILILAAGCEEKTVIIPELKVGERKVLVEELTGVRCQNCPKGAEDLRVLGESLGENLIVVALHAAASYDQPYGNSKYDFRSPDCRAIADYLYVNGDPGAPAAAIDRIPTLDEDFTNPGSVISYIFINRPWLGTVNARVAEDPEVGVFLSKKYDETSRELEVTVNVSPDQPQTGELRLSVYITEDSIRDVQNDNNVIVLDYLHRHVFRDALTTPTGDDISAEMAGGQPFSKTYKVTLPDNWVATHCSIVGFVHRHGDSAHKQILQANEIHLK